MPLPTPPPDDVDRAATIEARTRVADAAARVSLLDDVVSRREPSAPHAAAVRRARDLIVQARDELDVAWAAIPSNPPSGSPRSGSDA